MPARTNASVSFTRFFMKKRENISAEKFLFFCRLLNSTIMKTNIDGTDEETIPTSADLHQMLLRELKSLCRVHGLKITGNKDELVNLLVEKSKQRVGVCECTPAIRGAAIMFWDHKQKDEIKYKVKLGRPGAVMLETAE
jgi:hypothetical protein